MFINDISNEFDLLIINKDAKPKDFINSFNANDVYAAIEVKKSGPIGDLNEFKTSLNKIKEIFTTINKKNPKIICCYLAMSERIPKKKFSIHYVKETKLIFRHYGAFCLSNHPKLEIPEELKDEWENFLKCLNLI